MLIRLGGPVAEWMQKGSVRETIGDLLQAAEHRQSIRPELERDAATRLAKRQRRYARAVLEQAWPAVHALALQLTAKGMVGHDTAETIYSRKLPGGVSFELLRCPLREGKEAEAFFADADRRGIVPRVGRGTRPGCRVDT